ncbi:unnamed protein product [Hyaloperonospora brassicae]|uniref:Elicitin n=1 Tax=Hyaloperonospora brassicae TaxID=162125 RepID=A0AAV0T8G8_HYABA|nr:unnamed protein product [Hyaloperonospora brassicae]
MQSGFFLSFLLTACGAAVDDSCPPATIAKLSDLYADPHLHSCQKVISETSPTSDDTKKQVETMCTSDECRTLIADILTFKHADCNLTYVGVEFDVRELADRFDHACQNGTDESRDTKKYALPPTTTKNDTMDHGGRDESVQNADDNDTHVAATEIENDDSEMKPPLNATAKEFFPTPNTTYKATVPKTVN